MPHRHLQIKLNVVTLSMRRMWVGNVGLNIVGKKYHRSKIIRIVILNRVFWFWEFTSNLYNNYYLLIIYVSSEIK